LGFSKPCLGKLWDTKICPCSWGVLPLKIGLNAKELKGINFLGFQEIGGTKVAASNLWVPK